MYQIRINTPNYVPTFLGKHNSTRCKAWLVLYDRYLGRKRGLTLRELAVMTGISYGSLAVSLTRWLKWRYIGYRTTPKGRIYQLRKRGKDWLERWWYTMPLRQYLEELEKVETKNITKGY